MLFLINEHKKIMSAPKTKTFVDKNQITKDYLVLSKVFNKYSIASLSVIILRKINNSSSYRPFPLHIIKI